MEILQGGHKGDNPALSYRQYLLLFSVFSAILTVVKVRGQKHPSYRKPAITANVPTRKEQLLTEKTCHTNRGIFHRLPLSVFVLSASLRSGAGMFLFI